MASAHAGGEHRAVDVVYGVAAVAVGFNRRVGEQEVGLEDPVTNQG